MAEQETCKCEHCGAEVVDPLYNYCVCAGCAKRGCPECMDLDARVHHDCTPMEPFKAVDIVSEVTRSSHEHEVFLSFNDDDGAVAFEEWWDSIGARLFNKWLESDIQWGRLAEKKGHRR